MRDLRESLLEATWQLPERLAFRTLTEAEPVEPTVNFDSDILPARVPTI